MLKLSIPVKYADPNFETIVPTENGDWIDLKTTQDISLKAGEKAKISLGLAMKIPEGYEVWLLPRSSTFDKYGIIQTNSMGIIDNSYRGDNDIWKMPVYATKDVEIPAGTRLCQFRIMWTMKKLIALSGMIPEITFDVVDTLGEKDRGGFGTSGN